VLSGFVFTSDQVYHGDYLDIGSMVRDYISHGFGVYSHVFGGVSKAVVWTTNTKVRIRELWIEGQ